MLATALTAAGPGGEPGLPAADGVRVAAAPFYNAFRVSGPEGAEVATGTVTVAVVVNSEGGVDEATLVDAPDLPFLASWATAAALEWEFEPTPGSRSRSYRLTFSFDGETISDSPRAVQTSYERPLTLHVVYNQPAVVHLDHSSFASKAPRCPVHDVPMAVHLVPVRYGLPAGYAPEDPSYAQVAEFWDARERLFPNAKDVLRMGCIVGTETSAEVLECPSCRKAKRDWLSDHPKLPAELDR